MLENKYCGYIFAHYTDCSAGSAWCPREFAKPLQITQCLALPHTVHRLRTVVLCLLFSPSEVSHQFLSLVLKILIDVVVLKPF